MPKLKNLKSFNKSSNSPFPNGKKAIMFQVDAKLYEKFRIRCIKNNTNMTAVLRELLEDCMENTA